MIYCFFCLFDNPHITFTKFIYFFIINATFQKFGIIDQVFFFIRDLFFRSTFFGSEVLLKRQFEWTPKSLTFGRSQIGWNSWRRFEFWYICSFLILFIFDRGFKPFIWILRPLLEINFIESPFCQKMSSLWVQFIQRQ